MDTYWCPQPACPAWAPLLSILRCGKSSSIPALPGDTSKGSTSQSADGSCSAWMQGHPRKVFCTLGACTDRLRAGKAPGTPSEPWNQGRDMRKRGRALKSCFPEDLAQMAENDWDELKLWYFCHWKGTKHLMLLYNFRCSGLCLK